MSNNKNDTVTGVKTNGAVSRETMASGKATGYNRRPRVHSPAGIKIRVERRKNTYRPRPGSVEGRFERGFREPGSRNPRKVGR